jgi:hypothetical protein
VSCVERLTRISQSLATRLIACLPVAALVVAGTACGDSTAPQQAITVSVSVTHVAPPLILGDDSQPRIACDVEFSAAASGGDGSAKWLDAKGLWYAGIDRSTPFDSATWSAKEIQGSWDEAGIGPGQTQRATWTFYASVPFTTALEFHYQPVNGGVTGDEKTAIVEFACGPIPSTGTPDPTITALATGPMPETLEPSDTLTVEYSAASPAGLWQTAVVLSGPCEVHRLFAERLETSVNRSTRIAIPPECELGVPLVVSVIAEDAGLRTNGRELQTHAVLVDETPPVLSALHFPPAGTGIPPYSTGYFFGGDSIPIWPLAADNHALGKLSWEVLPDEVGLDGSLPLTGSRASPTILIRLPLEASGAIQIRLRARDAVGLESEAISTAPGAIHVYPTVDHPSASARVDGQTYGAIADTKRGVVYLLQSNAHRIAVLSLATMTVTGTIPLPVSSFATGFDITTSGDSLVVVLPATGALGIVDLRESPPRTTIIPLELLDSAKKQRPAQVRVLSNGKAFVTLEGLGESAFQLIDVDLATGEQHLRTDAGNGGQIIAAMGRSLDHNVLVVNGGPGAFQRYDIATDHFDAGRSPKTSGLPVLDATGQYVAVGFDIYDGSLQFLRGVDSPVLPATVPTVLSSDGRTLYQLLSGTGLLRSSVSDGTIVDRAHNPIEGLQLWISDDGSLIVTAGWDSDNPSNISTIDTR